MKASSHAGHGAVPLRPAWSIGASSYGPLRLATGLPSDRTGARHSTRPAPSERTEAQVRRRAWAQDAGASAPASTTDAEDFMSLGAPERLAAAKPEAEPAGLADAPSTSGRPALPWEVASRRMRSPLLRLHNGACPALACPGRHAAARRSRGFWPAQRSWSLSASWRPPQTRPLRALQPWRASQALCRPSGPPHPCRCLGRSQLVGALLLSPAPAGGVSGCRLKRQAWRCGRTVPAHQRPRRSSGGLWLC